MTLKFSHIHLTSNAFFKCAGVIAFMLLSNIFNAQTFLNEEIEMLNKPNARYEQIKDSLPFYFFKYANGSAYYNETNFDQNNLKARCYIVNFPVLINGNFDQDPYNLWVDAIKFKAEPALTKLDIEKIKSEEKNKKELEAKKKKEGTNATDEEDPIQKEKRLMKEAESKARMQKDSSIKNTTISNEPKEVLNDQKNSVIEEKKNSNSLTKELLIAKNFPDSIITRIFALGESDGLRWIYNQQIVAGNVLFCNTESSIPVFQDKGEADAIEVYKKLLVQWKQQYQSIWNNSSADDHLLIAESVDLYLEKNAKAGMMSQNYSLNQKQYFKELSKTGVQ